MVFAFWKKDRFSVTYFSLVGVGENAGKLLGADGSNEVLLLAQTVPCIDQSAPSLPLFAQESPVGDDVPVDFSFIAVELIVHNVSVWKTTSEVEEQVK